VASPDGLAAPAAPAVVDVDAPVDGAGLGDLGLILVQDSVLLDAVAAVGAAIGQGGVEDLVDALGDRSASGRPVGGPGFRPGRLGRRAGSPLENGAACRLPARLA